MLEAKERGYKPQKYWDGWMPFLKQAWNSVANMADNAPKAVGAAKAKAVGVKANGGTSMQIHVFRLQS